jgi:hypothetical protein
MQSVNCFLRSSSSAAGALGSGLADALALLPTVATPGPSSPFPPHAVSAVSTSRGTAMNILLISAHSSLSPRIPPRGA